MKHILLLVFMCLSATIYSQSPGDTIRVKAWDFESTNRDTMVSFPSDPNIDYEKIILKYTMRCKDGLVSDGTNRNRGCGEWDFSCNTYLVDSSKIETVVNTVTSHEISNFDGTNFSYSAEPVYDLLRGTQAEAVVTSVQNEQVFAVGTDSATSNATLKTENAAGKSQFLYTADELIASGLQAGEINAMSLDILDTAGEAQFMKIKMKQTAKTELDGNIDTEGFTEVYYRDTDIAAAQSNRFQFHESIEWDGVSSLLVEFTFTNVQVVNREVTWMSAEETTTASSLVSTSEREKFLTNQGYVECNDYNGIGGNQNRTVEAWIKTTDGTNAEIVGWGTNVTGRKWVFRMTDGRLRLEVHGGGTESTNRVDDGEWHHVACVLDGDNVSDIKFYIDGVLDENQTVGNVAMDTDINSQILRVSRGVNNRYIDGQIDDVRIWDEALSEETINEWKSLKVNPMHPNFENLQLDYQFSEAGTEVFDLSGNGRDAQLIGQDFPASQADGETLFKDFELGFVRPHISFIQGDFDLNVTTVTVDRPIIREPLHFVVERSITKNDPNQAFDDEILVSDPTQRWSTTFSVFDELTGELIEEGTVQPDGEITITDLEYDRRFPFYNELVSFVTPYGIGLDFGMEGESWFFDMTDYMPILQGDKRIIMTLGGQWQEDMDLEFQYIVGTPPRDVIQFDQIWQGTNRIGNADINDIRNDVKLAPTFVEIEDATTYKLKSSITGHGSQGEFIANGGSVAHQIALLGIPVFSWDINQECSLNPIFPQGGTWVFDRQGWCPGERSFIQEFDITPVAEANPMLEIDYTTSAPIVSDGDYRYHIAHQIVGYGPANFNQDAAVVEIITPNNSAEYTRVGTTCGDPVIVIRNTGATNLTELTINYWLNDSQSQQTFTWTGDLSFMEDEEVSLPASREMWFDFQNGDNFFHVEISNPNGGTDEYPFNNTFRSMVDRPALASTNFTLDVRTNNNAFENSYVIQDVNGNVVASNSLPNANTSYRDDYELPSGCYKLIFTDTGQDGLQWWANPNQGSGTVTLIDAGIGLFLPFQPDFGGGFEYNFTSEFPLSNDELDFLTSISVYPNPSSEFVTIEAEDLSDARVQISDMQGRIVQANMVRLSDTSIRVSVSDLISGLYFIVFQKEDVVTTRKLIVE